MRLELLSSRFAGLRSGALAWLLASTAGIAPALAARAPAPPALARLATASARAGQRVAVVHRPLKPGHPVAVVHRPLKPGHPVVAVHRPLKPGHPVATPAPPRGLEAGSGAAPEGTRAATSLPPAAPAVAVARSSSDASAPGAELASGRSAALPLTGDAMASVAVPPPPPPPEPVFPAAFDPLAEVPGATPAPAFVLVPPATLALPVSSTSQLARYFPNPLAGSPAPVPGTPSPAAPALAAMPAAVTTPAPTNLAAAPQGPTEPIIRLQREGPGISLDTAFLPQDEDFVLTASIPRGQGAAPSPAPALATPAASAGAPQPLRTVSADSEAIQRREVVHRESNRSVNATYTQRMVWQTPPPVSVASESIAVLELYSTAQQLAYAHKLDLAMLSIDEALAMEPTNPTLLALQGSLYYGKGAVGLARESWAQALLYDPTMSDVRTALAHLSSAPAFPQ